MSVAEYAVRTRDYVGATYVVRLRFEAPKERNVFLYAPYCGKPMGYVLERSNGKITWLAARRQDPFKSPGFKQLEVHTGSCFLLMTASAAYEWEEETEPVAPNEEARSIFVTHNRDEQPIEIVSDWYKFPAK